MHQCAFQAGLNVNQLTKIATCKCSYTVSNYTGNYHLFVVGGFFLTQIMLCTHKTATILYRHIVLHYRMSNTVILPPPSTALVSQKLSRLMVTPLSMCRTNTAVQINFTCLWKIILISSYYIIITKHLSPVYSLASNLLCGESITIGQLDRALHTYILGSR